MLIPDRAITSGLDSGMRVSEGEFKAGFFCLVPQRVTDSRASMEDLSDIPTRLRLADLNHEESTIHFVPRADFEDGKKVFANSCYGKMLADKEFHINGGV